MHRRILVPCGIQAPLHIFLEEAYCSRSCGTRATARKATLRKRAKEHSDKLRRAAASAQTWVTSRATVDWKQWVSAREKDITQKWLTRADNKGELQPPLKKNGNTPRTRD